jgi:hypothetical protein
MQLKFNPQCGLAATLIMASSCNELLECPDLVAERPLLERGVAGNGNGGQPLPLKQDTQPVTRNTRRIAAFAGGRAPVALGAVSLKTVCAFI